jgi:hypothetical protein
VIHILGPICRQRVYRATSTFWRTILERISKRTPMLRGWYLVLTSLVVILRSCRIVSVKALAMFPRSSCIMKNPRISNGRMMKSILISVLVPANDRLQPRETFLPGRPVAMHGGSTLDIDGDLKLGNMFLCEFDSALNVL